VDVDAAGIIYFASPLRWAERLCTHWIHSLGHPHRQLFSEGFATPVVNVTVDYRSHLSLDDEIRLELAYVASPFREETVNFVVSIGVGT